MYVCMYVYLYVVCLYLFLCVSVQMHFYLIYIIILNDISWWKMTEKFFRKYIFEILTIYLRRKKKIQEAKWSL